MKKMIGTIIAAVMILSLAGCGNSGNGSNAATVTGPVRPEGAEQPVIQPEEKETTANHKGE